jgi:hypothetical protein
MTGIKEIAQSEGSYSVRKLQSRYGATSARHLLAAYAIKQKYRQLGEVFSPLGLPIDDDLNAQVNISTKANSQGGYEAQFRGGPITIQNYDNDPIVVQTNKVKIWFVGLECLYQQEGMDEIYGTIGVITPSNLLSRAVSFPPGAEYMPMNEDAPRTVELNLLLYDDVPADLVFTVNLIEHDSGDIDEYKRRIAAALADAAKAGLGAVGVPAEATAASQGFMGMVTWGIVNVVSGWLGADDDAYDPHGFRVSARDILVDLGIKKGTIQGATPPFQDKKLESPVVPLKYNIDPVIVEGMDQGGDLGRYALYFKVETYWIDTSHP